MHFTRTSFYSKFSNKIVNSCYCRDSNILCDIKLSPNSIVPVKNFSFIAWAKSKLNNFKTMDELSIEINPPSSVRYMKELNREAFVQKIVVPSIIVNISDLNYIFKKKKRKLKKEFLLRIPKVNPVQDDGTELKRHVCLDPFTMKTKDIVDKFMKENEFDFNYEFSSTFVTLQYENFNAADILRAILPEETESCSSFEMVGHILHLNLKDHLLPYKRIIGEVFLDKVPAASLVVNKTNSIDNTYRSFEMEKIAGEGDMMAKVIEHGVIYKFDFSKVYWNSRLLTEHNRITEKIHEGDVMYDVMAGIGPFAIPAAKKNCTVLANDLNPFSYEYLEKNIIINKVEDKVKSFNMDGNEFIRTVVKDHLINLYRNTDFIGNIHILMNLPALAVTFLPSFIGLFVGETNTDEECDHLNIFKGKNLPIVHVYMFAHNETKEYSMHMVANQLGYIFNKLKIIEKQEKELITSEILDDIDSSFVEHVKEVTVVRRVAPNKIMTRVSFSIPADILLDESLDKHKGKKIKLV